MTENGNGGRGAGHSPRNTGGRNHKSGRGYSSEGMRPKSADEAIPVLRYGPNNNFVEFKKRLSIACLEKYKGLGRLIEYGIPFFRIISPNFMDANFDGPHAWLLGFHFVFPTLVD